MKAIQIILLALALLAAPAVAAAQPSDEPAASQTVHGGTCIAVHPWDFPPVAIWECATTEGN